jgi:transcriptional regulator GlxA family with amidase domain
MYVVWLPVRWSRCVRRRRGRCRSRSGVRPVLGSRRGLTTPCAGLAVVSMIPSATTGAMAEIEGCSSLWPWWRLTMLGAMSSDARRIALVAYPDVQTLDVVGPAEVLAGADRVIGGGAYALTIATPDGRSARSDAGLRLEADCALGEIDPPLDTLMVAGGWSYRSAMEDAVLIGEVRRLARRSRRVASVCTGAFILARAGLLDGRKATTHWAACRELAEEFSAVCVEPDRIYVRDGPIITSAGVTAGMDLALALVQEDHGAELARQVARWLVMFVHRPGGQSQFSERLAHPVSAS